MHNYDIIHELFEDEEDVEVMEPGFEEPDKVEAVVKGPQGFLMETHTEKLLDNWLHIGGTRKELGKVGEKSEKDVLFIARIRGGQYSRQPSHWKNNDGETDE